MGKNQSKDLQRKHQLCTAGEALFSRIRSDMLPTGGHAENHPWLEKWDLNSDWSEYIEQATILFITRRLLYVAKALDQQHPDKKLARKEVLSFLREHFEIEKSDLEDWARLSMTAVEKSNPECSPGISKKIKAWAQREFKECYICAAPLEFSVDSDSDNAFTLEHIWPRTYGGDSSEEENILPACKKCNTDRKKHFALWSDIAVHSVHKKVATTDKERDKLDGVIKYALHQRRLLQIAIKDGSTLKTAAKKLGPWLRIPEIVDESDNTHFFNLRNYSR